MAHGNRVGVAVPVKSSLRLSGAVACSPYSEAHFFPNENGVAWGELDLDKLKLDLERIKHGFLQTKLHLPHLKLHFVGRNFMGPKVSLIFPISSCVLAKPRLVSV